MYVCMHAWMDGSMDGWMHWYGMAWSGLVWYGMVVYCLVLFCIVLYCIDARTHGRIHAFMHACMQYMYVTMQLCNYATMQLCSYVAM